MRFGVVLTAAIIPQTHQNLLAVEPQLRRDAVLFAMNHPSFQAADVIVVLENSGFDLEWFRQRVSSAIQGKIHFISVPTPKFSDEEGYSRGEFEMMRHFFMRPEWETILEKADCWFKGNGKLYIVNLPAVLQRIRESLPLSKMQFYGIGNFTSHLDSFEGRFYGGDALFWKGWMEFNPRFSTSNGYYMEQAIAQFMIQVVVNRKTYFPFPELPIVRGLAGHAGKEYPYSFWKSLLKKWVYRMWLRIFR